MPREHTKHRLYLAYSHVTTSRLSHSLIIFELSLSQFKVKTQPEQIKIHMLANYQVLISYVYQIKRNRHKCKDMSTIMVDEYQVLISYVYQIKHNRHKCKEMSTIIVDE
jgi:hypothetical protein